MVKVGIFPFKENSHRRTGNRTRDLMISSQRLWPLDHEAGQIDKYINLKKNFGTSYLKLGQYHFVLIQLQIIIW